MYRYIMYNILDIIFKKSYLLYQEYWIKYKYGETHSDETEMPKSANKSFIGIQFTRPMPKGKFGL